MGSQPKYLLLLGAFFGAALVTCAVVPLVIRLAQRQGWVDRPGGRRIHDRPVPRVGGLAVFLGLLTGSSCYGLVFGWDSLVGVFTKTELVAFFAPCLLVFLVGLLDDIRNLSPTPRLLVEAIAATAAMQHGYVIDVVANPFGDPISLGYMSYPITLVWFVGVTNAFNLIDGLDGLLATVGLAALLGCASVGLYAGMSGTPALALALAGALVGFLPWNWRPAKIFLGDSGSLLIGFTVAAWSLKVSRNPNGGLAIHVPFALCALPIAEATLTLARRYVSGQPFFVGDKSHIHHVLLKKGLSVPRSVAVLGGVSLLFAMSALLSRTWRSEGAAGWTILVLVIVAFFGLRYLGYVELRVVLDRMVQSFRQPRRGLPNLLAVARAGDLVRDASSLEELEARMRLAANQGRFTFLALEFNEPLAGATTIHEADNQDAEAYLRAAQDGDISWLFSGEPVQRTPGAPPLASVCLSIPLTLETGEYGRLVCHRNHLPDTPSPPDQDVRRYLAEPIARVLERLRQGAPPA